MFFGEIIQDKEDQTATIAMEFGRSSFYDGESLMYFRIDDTCLIVDEKKGREIYESMKSLAVYLGYEK